MKINKKILIIGIVFFLALLSYVILNDTMNQPILEGSLPPREDIIQK